MGEGEGPGTVTPLLVSPCPPGDLPGQPRHHQTLDGVERAPEVILIILIVLAIVDDPEVEPAELVVRVVHAEVQLEGDILPLGRYFM